MIHKNARANMVAGKQPGLPQITFADEAQVFIGGKEVSAHHLGRGHTNGDAVILFPTERVLHTGDLFVNGSAPFIDYSAKGSIVEWDKTLDRVLQLDFDIVIPGHGPVAKKADLMKWRDSIAELRSTREDGLRGRRGGCGEAAESIGAGDGRQPRIPGPERAGDVRGVGELAGSDGRNGSTGESAGCSESGLGSFGNLASWWRADCICISAFKIR